MPVFISIQLPFCLYLKDDDYPVVVPELGTSDEVIIRLSKFQRASEKIDYRTAYGAEKVGRGELWNDPNGTFRRSQAIVIFPVSVIKEDTYTNGLIVGNDMELILESTFKAINRFLTIYRYTTGDTYIPVVHVINIYNVFQVGIASIDTDGTLRGTQREVIFENRLVNTQGDYGESVHQELRNIATRIDPIPLFEEFLMNARARLQERRWSMAIIEAQTGFEIFVNQQVKQHYLSQGMSESAANNVLKCGLKELTTVHLQRATGLLFQPGQAHYDKWQQNTYALRNMTVHEGCLPSLREAYMAVISVEEALEYLISRPKDRFWSKKQPPTLINEFFEP